MAEEIVERLEAFVRAVVREMDPRADVEEALDLIRAREALQASLTASREADRG